MGEMSGATSHGEPPTFYKRLAITRLVDGPPPASPLTLSEAEVIKISENAPPPAAPPAPSDPPASRVVQSGDQQKSKHTWPKRVGFVGAVVLALLAGAAIGAAAHSQTNALNTANRKVAAADRSLASARGQVTSLQGQVETLEGQASSLQTQASNATSIANAKAAATYAARNATLKQQASNLKQQQASIAAEEGTLQAHQISEDGVYVVGQDVKSGTWHTPGDGGSGDQCYYATLGSTDTSNILDNNNFDGPETVDLSGAYAFQISGPCTWYLTG